VERETRTASWREGSGRFATVGVVVIKIMKCFEDERWARDLSLGCCCVATNVVVGGGVVEI